MIIENRSKLLSMHIKNLGCIGSDGLTVKLDNIVCLVGKNNSGKSTVLRAYEIARDPQLYIHSKDRCNFCGDESTFVELEVHIPYGIGNVDEKWKEERGKYLVLKSQWEWNSTGYVGRKTWDPESNDWASGNAGGADNVFKSRLPRSLRIGSLEDASKAQETLLALTLSSLKNGIESEQKNPDSDINKSIESLIQSVSEISEKNKSHFDKVSEKIQSGFCNVFPGLNVNIKIEMQKPNIKIDKLLEEGSSITVGDGVHETNLTQQGAGARRALFWAILQVHNELKREDEKRKEEAKTRKVVKKPKVEEGEDNDPAFPGYLLLIDEPENALHPIAARAAQKHLYNLASDPDWQVILTTHSPYFVNPFEDHTTIVRMEKDISHLLENDRVIVRTQTYSADDACFSSNEKSDLQCLQNMDADFSEVFFGSFPILVEGDTEHAAFMAAIIKEGHSLENKITVIRARGKAILLCLIKMMEHFKISFGILHDVDWPYNKSNKKTGKTKNSMWTMNKSIYDAVEKCRSKGIVVSHMCSLPDFERELGNVELGKDKPLAAYKMIDDDLRLKSLVIEKLEKLSSNEDISPFDYLEVLDGDYQGFLLDKLKIWCAENGCGDDERLSE